jgi:hypothetical protein
VNIILIESTKTHGDFDKQSHETMAWTRQRLFIARKCKLDKDKNYILGDE